MQFRSEEIHRQLIADKISGIKDWPLPENEEWQGNIRELINYVEASKILN